MIGENIKSKRKEQGMTLEELANKVNTTRQTISRYETGVITNIPLEMISKIAKSLNTTPAYLMGWEEKKPTENDELDEKINDAFNKLSDSKKQEALNFLRFLQGK